MVATTFMEPTEAVDRVTARGWVLRGIGVLVVWSAWAFLVGAVVLLTRKGGTPAGPAIAVVAMLVALVPTWFLVRRSPVRRWLLLGAAVVLAAVGLNLGALGGPSLARMTGVGASLPVATGAQLLTISSVENGLCLQECSQVTHLYAVVDSAAAQAKVGSGMLAGGWDAVEPGTFCRDQFGVRLSDVADPSIEDPPSPPPGMELLSVSTGRCEHP
ncbi:hypothetical protein [Cellulomonas sp. P5_C5]